MGSAEWHSQAEVAPFSTLPGRGWRKERWVCVRKREGGNMGGGGRCLQCTTVLQCLFWYFLHLPDKLIWNSFQVNVALSVLIDLRKKNNNLQSLPNKFFSFLASLSYYPHQGFCSLRAIKNKSPRRPFSSKSSLEQEHFCGRKTLSTSLAWPGYGLVWLNTH